MTDNKQLPTYIIGNTPFAYILAAKLLLAEEKVFLMSGKHDSLFSSSILLREDSLLQKNRLQISTAKIMHENAKMVIFDITPDCQKSYFNYFSQSKACDCPIISFCHSLHPEILDSLTQHKVINAYFSGYSSLIAENTLISHNSRAEITVSTNEQHPYFETIQNILSKTYFKISFNSNNLQNFWKHFIPHAACSLFSNQYSKNIKEAIKLPEQRQTLNTLVDEIISLIPCDCKLNKEQTITDIYSIPANYSFPNIQNNPAFGGEFLFITDTLQKQTFYKKKSIPLLNKIINQALRQIITPVESDNSLLKKLF